jgi:F0F1-type ATP synthase epsilon subunit
VNICHAAKATLICSALVISSTALASSPRQSWASKDGVVDLKANGVKIEAENALNRLLIQEAFARWGVGYDEARLDVLRTLFTRDAEFRVLQGSREPIASASGIDEIIKNVANALPQQSDQRRHAMTNIVIDRLTKNEATAIAYGIVTIAADGVSVGVSVIYSANLRREQDGVWRFSKFVIGMDDYSGKRIVNPK